MDDSLPQTRRELERAVQTLFDDLRRTNASPGSYRSDSSVRCFECMFTTDSIDCYQCTYCDRCEGCSGCTHCRGCTNCHASNYCIDSVNCAGCSYVLNSRDCFECVFCFGCAGLVKKEFHILNRPYPRDEYFRQLDTIKKLFGWA